MPPSPEPAIGRIRELDGIRGLAILAVLVWHYLVCEVGAPPPLFRFLNLTWSGVDLFVLSGFLIGGILLDHRDARNYFSVFYRRRICRIFPLYYATLLLFLLLRHLQSFLPLGVAAPWLFDPPMPLWSYATFTQNFLQAKSGSLGAGWLAVTWSLSIEEQFYLLLPFIVRFTPVRLLPYLLAPFVLLAPLVRANLYDPSGSALGWYVLLVCKADALLLGVLCAWLIRQRSVAARLKSAAPILRIALASSMGFVLLTAYFAQTTAVVVLRDSLLALGFASLVMVALVMPSSPVARLTRVRWLRWLGVVSYGVYVIHQPVLGLMYGIERRDWPHFIVLGDVWLPIVALAITLLIAAASYRWFERPLLEYGRRWEYAKPDASFVAALPLQAPASRSG